MTREEFKKIDIDTLDSKGMSELISNINTYSEEDKKEIVYDIIGNHISSKNTPHSPNFTTFLQPFMYIIQAIKDKKRIKLEKEEEEKKLFNRELNIALLDLYTKKGILDTIDDLDEIINSPIKSEVLIESFKVLSEEETFDMISSIVYKLFPKEHLDKIKEVDSDNGKKLNSYLDFLEENSIIDKSKILIKIFHLYNNI